MSRPYDSSQAPLTRIIEVLLEEPGLTRAELVARVRLTRASVTSALGALQERGFLEQRVSEERARSAQGVGRPPLHLYLSGRSGNSIGIEVCSGEVHGALFDLAGTERVVVDGNSVDGVVDDLLELAAITPDASLSIGIAFPGPVASTGVLRTAGERDGTPFEPATALAHRLGVSVSVDSSANVAALAEHRYGAGRGASNVLYLDVSSSVSLGLILDGRLFRGAAGIAGEFGHVALSQLGPVCACGVRGCITELAGAGAVGADYVRLRGSTTHADVVTEALRGDPVARRLIADAGELIGHGLAAAINLLNPERVVVGGALAQADEAFLEPLVAAVSRRALPAALASTSIVPGALGPLAVRMGAASLWPSDLAERLARRVQTMDLAS